MPTFSGFFALSGQCALPAGRTLSRIWLPLSAAVCKHPRVASALALSAAALAALSPHGGRRSETAATDAVVFRPSGICCPSVVIADIGTCSIRRCDGQTLDIACRQEIRNTHDYSGIGNCPSQRRILEPVSGIGPEYSAWKADVLPLNYTGTLPPRHAPGRDIREEKEGYEKMYRGIFTTVTIVAYKMSAQCQLSHHFQKTCDIYQKFILPAVEVPAAEFVNGQPLEWILPT